MKAKNRQGAPVTNDRISMRLVFQERRRIASANNRTHSTDARVECWFSQELRACLIDFYVQCSCDSFEESHRLFFTHASPALATRAAISEFDLWVHRKASLAVKHFEDFDRAYPAPTGEPE